MRKLKIYKALVLSQATEIAAEDSAAFETLMAELVEIVREPPEVSQPEPKAANLAVDDQGRASKALALVIIPSIDD